MFEYIDRWLTRRKARRHFSEYSHTIDTFTLEDEGSISFANWKNPLIKPKVITQGEVNFFKKFIRKGSLCIDIGTNIGDTTVPMSLAAGKEGVTLGFDPNPHVFKIMEVNAALNKDKTNIIALPFAVTKEDGEFGYASSEASFGNGGLANEMVEDHGAFQLSTKIKGIALEKYLIANYADILPKLSFIKIDVEGADKEVIESISGLIRQLRPVIIAECFPKATQQERAELFKLVSDFNYSLYYFADFHENAQVIKIETAKDMNKWRTFNFYAIPIAE
ncbi:FkbM family methyltransferase [Dyadobacter crusticola]|uniref:FkbM family methyltransferase n=1 Tax=Dyadobacter crusticola TaxID=292407 RepID=UPI0004E1E955|nr:FkbM family methyltransferase [Dyadobacter crusticola]